MKKSVLSIVIDQEESRNLQRELQEQRRVREDKNKFVEKLEGLLMKFGDEVRRVEHLEKEIQSPQVDKTQNVTNKLMKPSDLPLFSGAKPVPREEGSFNQWMFQVQEALNSHSEEVIRSTIVRSVRGEARELMRFVGFQSELDVILVAIEE